jgi:hypothetical protein
MSDEEKQNEIDLIAFEAALASLVPRSDRLDRDRLMFLAGQQSRTGFQPVITRNRSKPTWAWPAAFSAMTAVATVLATLLVIRPTVPAMGPNPTAIAASANGDTSSLLRLPRCSHFCIPFGIIPIKAKRRRQALRYPTRCRIRNCATAFSAKASIPGG